MGIPEICDSCESAPSRRCCRDSRCRTGLAIDRPWEMMDVKARGIGAEKKTYCLWEQSPASSTMRGPYAITRSRTVILNCAFQTSYWTAVVRYGGPRGERTPALCRAHNTARSAPALHSTVVVRRIMQLEPATPSALLYSAVQCMLPSIEPLQGGTRTDGVVVPSQ